MRDEVLEAARTLIQRVGVDGFSYADIAKHLNISSPSIHHHFPSKADLVAEVAMRYRQEFGDHVSTIAGDTASDRLMAYAGLFDQPASSGLLCLCGAIAAEWSNIADQPRREVEQFFEEQHQWLEREIDFGVASGEFRPDIDCAAMARALLAALEGSMLMTRATTSPHLARSTCATLLASLVTILPLV